MAEIRVKRGTKAQVEAAKAASELAQGEPYLITDEGKLAVGTAVNDYKPVAMGDVEIVVGDTEPTSPAAGTVWVDTGSTTAADARAALGLVIGTDVQAYNADLTTLIASQSSNNGKVVGTDGTNLVWVTPGTVLDFGTAPASTYGWLSDMDRTAGEIDTWLAGLSPGDITSLALDSTFMTMGLTNPTFMTNVTKSTDLVNSIILASTDNMTLFFGSSTALSYITASSTAMTAVADSSTAKMAFFNSDIALTAVSNSSTALDAMRAAAQYVVFSSDIISSTNYRPLIGITTGASYIVLGVSTSGTSTGAEITVQAGRPGTTMSDTRLSAGCTDSDAALGTLVYPMASSYQIKTTDVGVQYLYAGLLRCDI